MQCEWGTSAKGGMLVRWETSDSAVATVEGSLQDYYGYEAGGTATVTAVGEGAVTITASWLGLTATVTGTTTMSDRSARSTPAGATLTKQVGVMVAAREIPDGARLEVSPAELRFSALGETQTLSIRIYDENGDEIEDPSMQVTGLTSLVWPDDPDDTEPVGGPVEWRTVPGGLEVTALGNGSGRISIMDMANGPTPIYKRDRANRKCADLGSSNTDDLYGHSGISEPGCGGGRDVAGGDDGRQRP